MINQITFLVPILLLKMIIKINFYFRFCSRFCWPKMIPILLTENDHLPPIFPRRSFAFSLTNIGDLLRVGNNIFVRCEDAEDRWSFGEKMIYWLTIGCLKHRRSFEHWWVSPLILFATLFKGSKLMINFGKDTQLIIIFGGKKGKIWPLFMMIFTYTFPYKHHLLRLSLLACHTICMKLINCCDRVRMCCNFFSKMLKCPKMIYKKLSYDRDK